MEKYSCFTHQFSVPPTNFCNEMCWLTKDPRCRIQYQNKLKQQQYEQQVSLVGFRIVDVKDLEE